MRFVRLPIAQASMYPGPHTPSCPSGPQVENGHPAAQREGRGLIEALSTLLDLKLAVA